MTASRLPNRLLDRRRTEISIGKFPCYHAEEIGLLRVIRHPDFEPESGLWLLVLLAILA